MNSKNIILLISLTVLSISVKGQSGGNGISKSTWGASDPSTCMAWFLKYIP